MCQSATLPITPINPTTGKEYSGGNVAKLLDCMDSNPRFVSGSFATFRQWLSVGRCVMKGEKGACRLLAYGDKGLEAKEEGKPDASGKRGWMKGFTVFALEQTAPIDSPDGKPDESATEEDKPEPGKVYSLATLATAGTWRKAEVPSAPRVLLDVEALRAKVDRLRTLAASCHADRLTNTAKRLGQAMNKRIDGNRALRAADMLSSLADDPSRLPGVSTREAIKLAEEAAIYESRPVSNGYHSYCVEGDKPRHHEAGHIAMRALLDANAIGNAKDKEAQIQAEAELRQCDIPGFFPTPPAVIAVMLEQAGDISGKRVLEPSAGKGDIVRAVMAAGAESVKAFECVPRLADYIAKHVVPRGSQCVVSQCADFLEQLPTCEAGKVDCVLMNPPFERDSAPVHVLHALSWLAAGGVLVSVMPANWADKPSAGPLFDAIESGDLSHMDVELDGSAFAGADAFRQTSTRTSLVVIRKPA